VIGIDPTVLGVLLAALVFLVCGGAWVIFSTILERLGLLR
jgi:hypothetical protein